jgi:hypothetical protein
VLRFQGCLGDMPRSERRVLELRAGVGLPRTRTRAEVARLTGLRRTRVARLERRGLKRLNALAKAGTCASASSTGAFPAAAGNGAAAPAADPKHPSSADKGPAIGVLGAPESEGATKSKGSSAVETAIKRPIIHGLGTTLDLGPLLLAFALGGLLYVVSREIRRSA